MPGDLDRLFDEVWPGFAPTARFTDFAPRVNIEETEEGYRVTAELPGLEEKDFEVSLEADVLTIKGEKKVESEEKREGYTHVEAASGSFHRSFRLPVEVDPDTVKATYKNGVLTVTLPKPAEESSRERVIPVESA